MGLLEDALEDAGCEADLHVLFCKGLAQQVVPCQACTCALSVSVERILACEAKSLVAPL